jgi:hypothetical protein
MQARLCARPSEGGLMRGKCPRFSILAAADGYFRSLLGGKGMKFWSPRRFASYVFSALALFAAISVLKGQDNNFDLRNYHRYVAYAWFHDRLSLDLAPAGMESYFNPTLDLPVYWLGERISAPVVAALIGAWQALIFVFTLLITDACWPEGRRDQRVLVAIAGVVAPLFWAELGTSQGDSTTAVFALAAIWAGIQIHRNVALGCPGLWRWALLSGFLLGTSTALKLTNVTVAVAAGIALVLTLRPWNVVGKVVACLLASGTVGFAIGGGWWFYEVWRHFGNPFFPQFGTVFPSTLAEPVSIGTTAFVPKNILSFVFRPVLMFSNPMVSSEVPGRPLLWPTCYLLAIGLALLFVFRRKQFFSPSGLNWEPPQRLVLWFVLVATLLWAKLFGVYRYTAAIEPLLPLCMVLLLSRWRTSARTVSSLNILLWLSIISTVLGAAPNWGHADWSKSSFRPGSPMNVEGNRPQVIVIGNTWSWLIPFLPKNGSYASLGTSFNYGRRFEEEVRQRTDKADRVYAVVGQTYNWRFDLIDKQNKTLKALGILDFDASCKALRWLIKAKKHQSDLEMCSSSDCTNRCQLIKPDSETLAVEKANQAEILHAHDVLKRIDLVFDTQACSLEEAYIGQGIHRFKLCALMKVSH